MYKLIIIICLLSQSLFAANIYIDTLPPESGSGWDGTNGTSYSGSPGVGVGYGTIQAGMTATVKGDTIFMRGGTYSIGGSNGIDIDQKYGTAWTEGNYFKMTSYPGEWAIIDGERNTTNGIVIHAGWPAFDVSVNAKYWWFERFEVTGGGRTDATHSGSAFFLNLGPFKYRYLYIHDNLSTHFDANASGMTGFGMQDSVIEYCRFDNNGSSVTTSHNNSHIEIAAYQIDEDIVAENGYDSVGQNFPGTKNLIIRYNYFTSSSWAGGSSGSEAYRTVGIKDKGGQFFTGRNPDGGHGWDDTYKDYGHKIHHNIFKDLGREGVFLESDFANVYQNIFDIATPVPSLAIQYYPTDRPQLYKVISYNNNFYDVPGASLVRYGQEESQWVWTQDLTHYGWDYNNIVSGGGGGYSVCSGEQISVLPFCASGGDLFDLSNYVGSYNFLYDPNDTDLYRLNDDTYINSGYEAQTDTSTPRESYLTSGSSPFIGSTGADKYITTGSFVLEDTTTISDGGVGGNHPYLSGEAIPSFVGATNPDDNDWVDGVLTDLASVVWLQSTTTDRDENDDPTWIEGSEASTTNQSTASFNCTIGTE